MWFVILTLLAIAFGGLFSTLWWVIVILYILGIILSLTSLNTNMIVEDKADYDYMDYMYEDSDPGPYPGYYED